MNSSEEVDNSREPVANGVASRPKNRKLVPLFCIGCLYLAWLLWLGYAAWINTAAGNQ